jgi:hypothetical protein
MDYSKSSSLRLQEVKQWLETHPTKSVATTSRLFKINRQSLYSSIRRLQKDTYGGYNCHEPGLHSVHIQLATAARGESTTRLRHKLY